MKLAVLLVAPALAACPAKSEKNDDVAAPTPEARATLPVPVHELLAYARSKAPGQRPWRVEINYVRPDGTIDPAYGEVDVWFSAPPMREPGDDPSRPTGAPIKAKPAKPAAPPQCHRLRWREGTWNDQTVACTRQATTDASCTVPIIWERAIAKGAPRDAVATLSFTLPPQSGQGRWAFRIEDKVRGVKVDESFPDDCGLVAEAPDPTVGPDTVLHGLDRKMIQNTIGTVKAEVRACADLDPTKKGTVTLTVKVAPDGRVSIAAVKQAPSEKLGACVAKAIQRATFPVTTSGGSFTYPFVF